MSVLRGDAPMSVSVCEASVRDDSSVLSVLKVLDHHVCAPNPNTAQMSVAAVLNVGPCM